MTIYQAHRGVSYERPENTMTAFREAVKQGYGIIECDPKVTKDMVCVMMHDHTLNRTARIAGQPFSEPTKVSDVNFADLSEIEVGSWFDERYTGEPIPTLAQALDYMRHADILCKIDNVWEHFAPNAQEALFRTVEAHGKADKISLTCLNLDNLRRVADLFPQSPLTYDGYVDEATLDQLAEIAQGRKVYVWLRLDNQQTSWCKMPPCSEALVASVKAHGFILGVWGVNTEEGRQDALRFGADVIETDGVLKP